MQQINKQTYTTTAGFNKKYSVYLKLKKNKKEIKGN